MFNVPNHLFLETLLPQHIFNAKLRYHALASCLSYSWGMLGIHYGSKFMQGKNLRYDPDWAWDFFSTSLANNRAMGPPSCHILKENNRAQPELESESQSPVSPTSSSTLLGDHIIQMPGLNITISQHPGVNARIIHQGNQIIILTDPLGNYTENQSQTENEESYAARSRRPYTLDEPPYFALSSAKLSESSKDDKDDSSDDRNSKEDPGKVNSDQVVSDERGADDDGSDDDSDTDESSSDTDTDSDTDSGSESTQKPRKKSPHPLRSPSLSKPSQLDSRSVLNSGFKFHPAPHTLTSTPNPMSPVPSPSSPPASLTHENLSIHNSSNPSSPSRHGTFSSTQSATSTKLPNDPLGPLALHHITTTSTTNRRRKPLPLVSKQKFLALKQRLEDLLPQMEAANAALQDAARDGNLEMLSMECLDEGAKAHIEMELALGVLEEKGGEMVGEDGVITTVPRWSSGEEVVGSEEVEGVNV